VQQQCKPSVLFWVAASAAVAMVVGGLGPWATTLGFSASGTEGDGWIAIVAGGLVAVGMVSARKRSFAGNGAVVSLLLAGTSVVVTSVYDITTSRVVMTARIRRACSIPGGASTCHWPRASPL
jgi:hypothetical protein